MSEEIPIDTNFCISCILKLTNYLISGHRCFVYSCEKSNSLCNSIIKFSFLKFLSCIFGFLSGMFTMYVFTNDLITDKGQSVLEFYLRLHMVCYGILATGNSFLWNVKSSDFKKSFVDAVRLEKLVPYPYGRKTYICRKLRRSFIIYWTQLVVFVTFTILEFIFFGKKHVCNKIFSLYDLNLFTCIFLELRTILDMDLVLKNRFKMYIENILKKQIDSGVPGDHYKDIILFQNLYFHLPVLLEGFKNYISLILPCCFLTFVPAAITYICITLEIFKNFNQVSIELLTMVLVLSTYGLPGVIMAGQVVKACDNLAFFVSIVSIKKFLINELKFSISICK